MFCKSCGTQMPDGTPFCPTCGTAAPAPAPAAPAAAPIFVQNHIQQPTIPEENRPLSPWGYWGLQILYAIPIVGFIFLIIHSCSGANINRRNFARSYWCSLILAGALLVLYLILGAAIGSSLYYYY